MNFDNIGPIQMMVFGFNKDADYQGLIIEELERLSSRGLIRIIDIQFLLRKDENTLLNIELSDLSDDEAIEYGTIISGLMGVEDVASTEEALEIAEAHYGMSMNDIHAMAKDLEVGEAVGVLLMEHVWAARLKHAIRTTGGFPIAQGLLTPEALMLVGEEIEAVVEAEVTIELAEAIQGAAILDTLATLEAAEQIKTAAIAEAIQTLIVAGYIEEAATQSVLNTLLLAGVIEASAIQEAVSSLESAQAEISEAIEEVEN